MRQVMAILYPTGPSPAGREFEVPTNMRTEPWTGDTPAHKPHDNQVSDGICADSLNMPGTHSIAVVDIPSPLVQSCPVIQPVLSTPSSTRPPSAVLPGPFISPMSTVNVDVVTPPSPLVSRDPSVGLPVSGQAAQLLHHSPSSRLRKKVTFHPDTEDNWIWANGGSDGERLPRLDAGTVTRNRQDLIEFKKLWMPYKAEEPSTPYWHEESQGKDAQHLTFYEPPPRQEDSITEDDDEDPMMMIIITAPTGEKRMWGAPRAFGTRLSKLLDSGLPIIDVDGPPTAGNLLPRKRRASELDEQDGSKKRKPLSEAVRPMGEVIRANGRPLASPSAGPSNALKRKAVESLEDQPDSTRHRSS